MLGIKRTACIERESSVDWLPYKKLKSVSVFPEVNQLSRGRKRKPTEDPEDPINLRLKTVRIQGSLKIESVDYGVQCQLDYIHRRYYQTWLLLVNADDEFRHLLLRNYIQTVCNNIIQMPRELRPTNYNLLNALIIYLDKQQL
jgi:hypothetical protein